MFIYARLYISGGRANYFALSILNGFLTATLTSLMIYIVTVYPSRNFREYRKQTPRNHSVGLSKSKSKSKGESDWVNIVSTDIEILHGFMRFLVRSFCVENMLFIIEIMQCKNEHIKIK